MSRPEHLSVPNTPAGIRRINEMQEIYDKDPEAYEANERADEERMAQEEDAKARWREQEEERIQSEQEGTY